jgi:alpha-L-rhamnosidase
MLAKGATTWWERWNGDTGDPGMNSYNHYAFGSVVAWVYRYVAGIDMEEGTAGFKKIVIRPHVDGRMKFARGEYDSAYGRIISDWRYAEDGSFRMKVEIPANTSAEVYLPAKAGAGVFEAGNRVKTESRGGEFLVSVGSGAYDFEVK